MTMYMCNVMYDSVDYTEVVACLEIMYQIQWHRNMSSNVWQYYFFKLLVKKLQNQEYSWTLFSII